MVLLQEFSQVFGVSAYCVGSPEWVSTWWLSLIKFRLFAFKANDESRDSKWSYSTLLSIFLLCFCNESSNILNCGFIFEVESETLALNSCLVSQHSGISLQSSKCEHNMRVDLLDFSNCSRILKLSKCLFLNCKYNAVSSFNSNCGGASVDCLKSILHLKKVAIWGKDSDSFIVSWHTYFKLFISEIY